MGLNDFVRKKALYYKRKFDTSDPFKLADLLGIEVMTCDIGSRLGCYMYLKRSKCIWINECLEGNERLFVMAHELGHAILHPKENCYFLRNQTFLNTRIEQEANAFAAEFLIPDEAIWEAMEYGYTIDQCARILGYEKELVELRMKRIS